MNIAFVNSIQMWGGGEVWLMDMVDGLTRRGHHVDLLCRKGTVLESRARDRGVRVTGIRFGGDFDPLILVRAARFLREKKIDVVCTNTDKDLRIGGLAAKLAGTPGIVPSREVDYPLKDKWRYRWMYNQIATAVAANSEATKKTLLKSAPWLAPEKIHVIYKGIDLEPFDRAQGDDVRKELGVAPTEPLVGFVGQVDGRKGIPTLLQAFRAVHQQIPEAKLVVAGKGPLQGLVEQQSRELDGGRSIVFAGFREDVPALMKALDVLVLPSIWEGFGYVLVEAMAAGKPTVASNTSSIPEIVVDGETGLLIDPSDPDSIAQSLVSLLGDPSRCARMGEAGRKRVENLFRLEGMLDAFETLFLAQLTPIGPTSSPRSDKE